MPSGQARLESALSLLCRGDGRRDLSSPGPCLKSVSLGDVVWADDVAECIIIDKVAGVGRQVAPVTANFAEAFATFGYTLSFGATKTAAIIRVRGEGSRAARSQLFQRQATLPILLENSSPASLPLVVEYKHLGMIQTATTSLLPELRLRCGSAWAAFRQGRKPVYRNKRISLRRRGILLASAVFTRLFYGAGAWHQPRSGEERVVSGAMQSIMRQTLCVAYDGDQHVGRAEACALLGLPDPQTELG